jgi:hypothetical protein
MLRQAARTAPLPDFHRLNFFGAGQRLQNTLNSLDAVSRHARVGMGFARPGDESLSAPEVNSRQRRLVLEEGEMFQRFRERRNKPVGTRCLTLERLEAKHMMAGDVGIALMGHASGVREPGPDYAYVAPLAKLGAGGSQQNSAVPGSPAAVGKVDLAMAKPPEALPREQLVKPLADFQILKHWRETLNPTVAEPGRELTTTVQTSEFLGPFYPYPQVPLAWRQVKQEWDDGWWFLDFNDVKPSNAEAGVGEGGQHLTSTTDGADYRPFFSSYAQVPHGWR